MEGKQDISILFIEDEETIAKPVTKFLKKYGFKIHHASTGKEALEQIRKENFNLVILDLNLPDTNGENLFELIEREQPGTKTIFTTGDITFQNGSKKVLYKPFTLSDILQAIRETLNKKI